MPLPSPPPLNWRSLMDVAFGQACKAAQIGEIPVGAALFTLTGELIAQAHNQPIGLHDPTGHAEILCLRKAATTVQNYRLKDTILAVTLEPCIMCTGALIHARVAGVVIGALDKRTGAILSNLDGAKLSFSNHHMWTISGIMENECSSILKRFFLNKRNKQHK